jgi:hypothetical protein
MPSGDPFGVLLSPEASGLRFVSRIHWTNTYNRNAQASKQIPIKMMRFMAPGGNGERARHRFPQIQSFHEASLPEPNRHHDETIINKS